MHQFRLKDGFWQIQAGIVQPSSTKPPFNSLRECMAFVYDHMPPRELALFSPRKLAVPGGYHSPKAVAGTLYTLLGETALKTRDNDAITPIEVSVQGISYKIINYQVPIYYV